MGGNPNPSPATRFSADKQPAEKGRATRKGTRDTLNKAFMQALAADFAEHGVNVIQTVREERPADYLKVVASLQPKEIEIVTPESALTDEQVELLYQTFLGRLEKPEDKPTVIN